MNVRAVLLSSLLGMLLATAVGQAVAAEEDAAAAIRFRRILVPEDRIKDWPAGDDKYLPIDAAEFERVVTAAQPHSASAPVPPAAAITSARYEATLQGDHLAGQASLDVALAGPAPAMLSLEPCNLALGKMAWDTEEPDAAKSPPGSATVPAAADADKTHAARDGVGSKTPSGVIVGLGGDGRLAAIVNRSGRLRFDWSLAAHRYPADVLGFPLEMPMAPASELWIQLPKNVTPAIDHGLLVGSEPAGDGARRWHIELGGHRRLRLRILPAGVASHRPQLALLREFADVRLLAPRRRSLGPVEASGPQRAAPTGDGAAGPGTATDLRPLRRRRDPLVGRASGRRPGGAGGADASRADPRRRAGDSPQRGGPTAGGSPLAAAAAARVKGLFWQEGNITLLMSEPLVTDRIAPLGCVQTGAGPLSAPRAGESLQFQAFEPEATVEVSLARRTPSLQALGATAVELGGEEVTARVAADFRVTETARFSLAADVSRPWIIDSVESMPPGAVADWTLEPETGPSQTLAIRLRRGLSPVKPLRLLITARRPFSAALQKLGVDHLAPLRFRDAAADKRLVAVRAADSYALKLSGAEQIERLGVDNLSPTELELFAQPPKDLLFACDARASSLRVSLIKREAKYSGTIRINAAVGEGVLRETCLLRCLPQSGLVNRVLVQFFPRRDTAPRWSLGGEEVFARKWSRHEQTMAGWDASLETWELTLRRPRNAAFEITAVREVSSPEAKSAPASAAGSGPLVLTLASLPEATSQTGTVLVRSVGRRAIHVDNRRLKPLPTEFLPPGLAQGVRDAYRYDPARQVAQGPPPRSASRTRISRTPSRLGRGTVIWNRGSKRMARPGTG